MSSADTLVPFPQPDRDKLLSTLPLFDRVRPHHWPSHLALLERLTSFQVVSYLEAAFAEADDYTARLLEEREALRQDPSPEAQRIYFLRRFCAVTDDLPSRPSNFPDDYLGDDPISYRDKLAQDNYSLLIGDGETSVTMGKLKDNACRAARYGLHCRVYATETEEAEILSFGRLLDDYMSMSSVEQRVSAQPEKYVIRINGAQEGESLAHMGSLAGRLQSNMGTFPLSLELPLGLYRDVLTWSTSHGRFYTFEALEQELNEVQRIQGAIS